MPNDIFIYKQVDIEIFAIFYCPLLGLLMYLCTIEMQKIEHPKYMAIIEIRATEKAVSGHQVIKLGKKHP